MKTIPDKLFWRALAAGLGLLFLLSLGWFGFQALAGGAEPWQAAANLLLLSLPLGLLCGSLALLAAAARQHSRTGRLGARLSAWVRRLPRAAGGLIAGFIALFSLDVFSEGGDLGQMLLALLLHSSPALGLALALALAWRWPWVGLALFGAAALWILGISLGRGWLILGNLLTFVLPLAAIAGLFAADWRWNRRA